LKTALSESGYGIGISAAGKAEFFVEDLKKLLDAYNVALMCHPFNDSHDLYIVNRGTCFADGRGRVVKG